MEGGCESGPRGPLEGLLVGSFLLATARVGQGQDYELSWYTIDGGGNQSSGGDYELQGTIGRPDAGVIAGGPYVLTGGFWGGVSLVVLQIVGAGREGMTGHQAFVLFEVSPPVAGVTYELEAAASPSGPWATRSDSALTGAGSEYMFSLQLDPAEALIFFRIKQVP